MKNGHKLFLVIAFLLFFPVLILLWKFGGTPATDRNNSAVSFVTIGDSFTIGHGLEEKERWPNVLVEDLQREGVDIRLAANPSVTGFTVRDAINYELSVVEKEQPDIVVVFIGTNDSFMGRSPDLFREDLNELLDSLQRIMKRKGDVMLITIPDYSTFPAVKFSFGKDLPDSIIAYNDVIKEEASKRGFKVADIFPVSQTMDEDDNFIFDGIHPTGKGYKKWERVILTTFKKILQNNSD